MPRNLFDIGTVNKTIEDMKTRLLGMQTSLSNLKKVGLGTDEEAEKLTTDLSKSLATAVPAPLEAQEKTIQEKFAERRRLAQEASIAERGLIEKQFEEPIEEARRTGEQELIGTREAIRGLVPASIAATMKFVEEAGRKRIRDLERQRDQLFLANKVAEAGRLDSLIIAEQEAITQARQNYINTIFGLRRELRETAAEERAKLAFETPEQRRQRELQTEIEKLKIQYSDIPGIENVTSTAGLISVLGPRLSEDRKRAIEKEDLENKKLRAEIRLKEIEAQTVGQPDYTKIFGNEMDLRKEYNARPVIKQYQEVKRSFRSMMAAASRLQEVKKTGNQAQIAASRAATDQVLGVVFQKLLDPESIVRESEFARTAAGQSIIQRAEAFRQQLIGGGIGITDELRQEMLATAQNLFSVMEELKSETDREFQAIAFSANKRGLPIDINNIIGLPIDSFIPD